MARRFRAKDLGKELASTAFVRKLQRRSRDVATAATDLVKALVGERRPGKPPIDALRRLARDARALDVHAAEPHSLGDHLASVVHSRLARLEDSRDFASAADPVEATHDLRVASRRLRAFVDVFAPLLEAESERRASKHLKRVTRAVSALRDLDVQNEHLGKRLAAASADAERALLEHLLEQAARERKRMARHAKKRLGHVDFTELRASVREVLGETVASLPPYGASTAELARALLLPFIEGARAHLPPNDGVEHPEAMHRLRIQVKKLRYALELFEPVLGDGYRELRGRAQRLQEVLGAHHDLVVLHELVERNRLELAARGRTTLLSGLESLRDALSAERRQRFEEFRADGFEPEWWERTLSAALATSTVPERPSPGVAQLP